MSAIDGVASEGKFSHLTKITHRCRGNPSARDARDIRAQHSFSNDEGEKMDDREAPAQLKLLPPRIVLCAS